MADASLRYPINDKLRIGPRIRFSYTDSKSPSYLIMPSVSTRYKFNKSWSFDTDVGARWLETISPLNPSSNVDFVASAGYRFEF